MSNNKYLIELSTKLKFTGFEVPVKRLSPTAILPTKAHESDAGFDLYADVGGVQGILPHHTIKISTGVSMAIPEGYFGGIYARSGLATKQGLRPSNCVGVIDSSYRGEIIVALYNDSDEDRIIKNGDRIAQLVIHPIPLITLVEVDELDSTDRGSGGFGSTGK